MFHFFIFDQNHFIWNCVLPVTEENKNADVEFNMFLDLRSPCTWNCCVYPHVLHHCHVSTCCKFCGFYSAVAEVSVLRCNAMSPNNWFPTFWDDIVVLYSRVSVSLYSDLDISRLEGGTTTSGTNYHLVGHHIPEEWRPCVCSCWLTNSVL